LALNKGQKAVLHVAKSKTGMTDDEYRALLAGVGVASSTDPEFTQAKFETVMRSFEKLGFVSTKRRTYRPSQKGGKAGLTAKITAIRSELGLTESYVDAIAQKMFGISSYRWLDAGQLHKLVAALSYHQKRKRAATR